jgi:hypothetical protein
MPGVGIAIPGNGNPEFNWFTNPSSGMMAVNIGKHIARPKHEMEEK